MFLGAATRKDLDEMYALTEKINKILIKLFDEIGIILVDFKIELGKTSDGKIILADEISPDTCRLWDKVTMEKLDKDRFRRDLGGVTEAYVEIYERLKKLLQK
jgi:phosphoribosylaminoimidazole-succinocarboxamide synthase